MCSGGMATMTGFLSDIGNAVESVAQAIVAPVVAPTTALINAATGKNVLTNAIGATEATIGSSTAALNNATGGALGHLPVVGGAIQTQSNIVSNPGNSQYVANAALTDSIAAAAGLAGGAATGAFAGDAGGAGVADATVATTTTAGGAGLGLGSGVTLAGAAGLASQIQSLIPKSGGSPGTAPTAPSAATSTSSSLLVYAGIGLAIYFYMKRK